MNGSDVKKIRTKTGLSQSQFCGAYGLNVFTLRQWERKNTPLDATATSYLTCIKVDASAIARLLQEPKKK